MAFHASLMPRWGVPRLCSRLYLALVAKIAGASIYGLLCGHEPRIRDSYLKLEEIEILSMKNPQERDRVLSRIANRHWKAQILLWLMAWCMLQPICPWLEVGHAQENVNESSAVRFLVSFPNAKNHYINVEATFPTCAKQQEVWLPVWTPGSYLVREYARHLDSVTAHDANEESISISKVSKNRWKVEQSEPGSVTIKYRVYCNELSVRTNFVDSQFALLNGAATFLTADEFLESEQIVQLKIPAEWQQAVTSLERRVQLGPHTFVGKDFDELVDSPFVVGNPTLHPFDVGDVEHVLVNVGGDGLWDGDKAAADVSRIVQVHQDMWSTVPYDRYFFLNVIAESGGGLEHDNSTVMLTSRWSFGSPSRYRRWLGLVSHEFFHTWNVRRLRPSALASYDYQTENYFNELWVAEGVTSYYDELALVRSGHIDADTYLGELSKQIRSLQTTKGRLNQSLNEASHDAWIKYYRPNENSKNTMISYYTKGAVVAFLLDMEIRRATGDQHSLDDVMRSLYEKHALKEGYTNKDVLAEVNEVTGKDLGEWLKTAIDSPEELDYAPAMEWLGLKFQHSTDAPETADVDSSKKSKTDTRAAWIGVASKSDGGKLTISSVTEGGPGFKAGLNVDDEIIAMNDYRVSGNFNDLLQSFKTDDAVELLIARRGALMEKMVSLGREPSDNWKIQRLPEQSDEEKKRVASWLHITSEANEETEEEADAPAAAKQASGN